MCWWYEADDVPSYLDAAAQRLLEEGRESYRRLSLGENPVLAWVHGVTTDDVDSAPRGSGHW
ncbi:hypothetical protein [Lentzea indica]|uniref:hypothetical protein n=1 Tax=Lentzea indica TaxID=2604800 RepID=UPI001CB70F54|nr:hypothetical protein [Lentzea indica]